LLLSYYKPRKWYSDLQVFFMRWWKSNPRGFRSVRKFFDYFLTRGHRKHAWMHERVPQPPVSDAAYVSLDAIRERYPMLANTERLFNPDFHVGSKKYGTFAIGRSLGFSIRQARRIGRANDAIDFNKSPYGRTRSEAGNAPSRHFNLNVGNPEKGDTRLIWAKRHLDAAVELARRGQFSQAEKELGYGLHSLQDSFAHGQMSPFTHFVLGSIPDRVEYNPTAMYEATRATRAYLKTYLKRILRPPKADSKDRG
jgi:hypothetical protein